MPDSIQTPEKSLADFTLADFIGVTQKPMASARFRSIRGWRSGLRIPPIRAGFDWLHTQPY